MSIEVSVEGVRITLRKKKKVNEKFILSIYFYSYINEQWLFSVMCSNPTSYLLVIYNYLSKIKIYIKSIFIYLFVGKHIVLFLVFKSGQIINSFNEVLKSLLLA